MVLLLRSPACSSMSCAHLRFHLRTVFFFFVQASFSFYSHVCVCALHRPLFETNAWKKKESFCAPSDHYCVLYCAFFFFYCNYYLAGNRERKVENYRKVLSCRDS